MDPLTRPEKIGTNLYLVRPWGCHDVYKAIIEAIRVADDFDATIQIELNARIVRVRKDSNPDLIYREWRRSGAYGEDIEPYPVP